MVSCQVESDRLGMTDPPSKNSLPSVNLRVPPAAPAPSLAPFPSKGTMPAASLIGEGPRQYLIEREDLHSFDGLKESLHGELRPADPIEQIWVDDVVDLEWSIHRLRKIRKSTVENSMKKNIAMIIVKQMNYPMHSIPAAVLEKWQSIAAKYINGEAEAVDQISTFIEPSVLAAQLEDAFRCASDRYQALGNSIMAAARQRDAALTRLYGRREAIAAGRIASPSK